MKKILKRCKHFVKKMINCARVLVSSVYFLMLTFLKGKRTAFSKDDVSKEVIILGNGPSLNDVDLEAVSKSGMDIACVNAFPCRNACFTTLKPKYLVLLDPDYFLPHEQLGNEEVELYKVLQEVDWELHVIVPQGKSLPVINPNLILERLCLFSLTSEYLTKYLDWFYKHNLLTIGYQNVVIGAGYYFISKQVKKLYFAGIDMSEFKQLYVDEQNRVYVDAIHNYGSERRYSALSNKGEFYKLLGQYQKMFEQFHYLQKYAERQNVETVNLSTCSYVDVFPKATLFFKEST